MGDPEPAPQRAVKVLVGVQFPGKGHPRPGLGSCSEVEVRIRLELTPQSSFKPNGQVPCLPSSFLIYASLCPVTE